MKEGFDITKLLSRFLKCSISGTQGVALPLVWLMSSTWSSSATVGRNHHLLAKHQVHSSCSEDVTEEAANASPDTLRGTQQLSHAPSMSGRSHVLGPGCSPHSLS